MSKNKKPVSVGGRVSTAYKSTEEAEGRLKRLIKLIRGGAGIFRNNMKMEFRAVWKRRRYLQSKEKED